MEKQFRLDRSAFKIQTFEESANQTEYWLSRPSSERLAAAWFLICQAWKLEYRADHRLDRTVFSMRKQPD